MKCFHYLGFALLALMAVSCGVPQSDPRERDIIASQSEDEETAFVLGDEFRTNLAPFVGVPPRIDPPAGATQAQQALVELDQQLLHFREQGLAFAISNPNDPVICEWLAATVAHPPSYADDPWAWADQQFDIVPNRSVPNIEQTAHWDETYLRLRASCLGSASVSDQLKRFILSSEMRQELFRERERFARSGSQSDAETYINRLLEFIERFPAPDEESPAIGSRSESYFWSVISVARPALSRKDTIAKSDTRIADFVARLDDIDSQSARLLAEDLRSNGMSFTFHPFSARHRAFEKHVVASADSFAKWYATPVRVPITVDAILYSTPTFPALNQPQNEIEGTSLHYDNYVGSLLVLEKGRRDWSEMGSEERYDWLNAISIVRGPAYFPKDPGAYVLGLVDGPANLDLEELEYWIAQHRSMTDELMSSGDLSTKEKSSVEIWFARRLFDAARLVNGHPEGHPDYATELLERMGSVVGRADEAPENYAVIASWISAIHRYSDELDLTETRVRAFLAQLPDTRSVEIQDTLRAALNAVDLTPGVAVRFELETMDREPFDTSDLAGNIVLIDHWDTNCAPCIAAMPGLHEVYQRYKDRGVEVVSIAYDGTSQRSRVERLKDEMGLTWITLNGEGLWPGVSAQYGYRGVPQYMLLDRDGRWVAGSEEMGGGSNFEALLIDLLDAEEAEQ